MKHRWLFSGWILLILFCIGVSASLIYWVLFLINANLSPYIHFLVSVICGVALLLFIFMLSHLLNRKRVFNLYLEILQALKNISNGNFAIQLQADQAKHSQFDELIEQINIMSTNLQQMEDLRQEFISNVSHEIQSPLTSIKGFAQVLKDDRLQVEERLHYLNIIEEESQRLSKLSDNLLKLTTLEAEQPPIEKTMYSLHKQLENNLLITEPSWTAKNIELDTQLTDTIIYADMDLMNQVWLNLIHNAIKFMPNDGKLVIHNFIDSDGEIVIHISDNGVGISPTDLPHIFERFYKVDRSRNRAIAGNGLGLSIVKKIIELHGGSISVQSKPSVGTTFEVRLPSPKEK